MIACVASHVVRNMNWFSLTFRWTCGKEVQRRRTRTVKAKGRKILRARDDRHAPIGIPAVREGRVEVGNRIRQTPRGRSLARTIIVRRWRRAASALSVC